MQRKRAFTLLEMLVVLAIISILAAILTSVLSSARRRSKSTLCASHLRQLFLAVSMYADDNEGTVIPMNQVDWRFHDPETNYLWYTNLLSQPTYLRTEFDDEAVGDVTWATDAAWACPALEPRADDWGAGYGLNEYHVHRYGGRNIEYGGAPLQLSRILRPSQVFSMADSCEKREDHSLAVLGIHPPPIDDDPPRPYICWGEVGCHEVAPRHLGRVNLVFFDGHQEALTYDDCRLNRDNMFAEDTNGDGWPNF